MIVVSMATHAGRTKELPGAVASLLDQTVGVDALHIYGNEMWPQPNTEDPRVHCHKIEPDLTDQSKFSVMGELSDHDIWFTCDDDIVYPPDYIERTLEHLQANPGSVITYHGRTLTGTNRNYYSDHRQHHFSLHTGNYFRVDVPGTGVMAGKAKDFRPQIMPGFKYVADLTVAKQLAESGVGAVMGVKPAAWLYGMYVEDSIYARFRRRDELQSILADEVFYLLQK